MSKYEIFESDRFLNDVEEAAIWILQSNLEQSENLALQKLYELQQDIWHFSRPAPYRAI